MSRTLNLSKTCVELEATRQTVRRHLTDLEAIKGEKLFRVEDRQYYLTPFGHVSIDGAKFVLRSLDIRSGQSPLTRQISDGLETSQFVDADGRKFFSQHHPVS